MTDASIKKRKRRRVEGLNGKKITLVEPVDCICGRRAKRDYKHGTSRIGTRYYNETVFCSKKWCKKMRPMFANSPNKATNKWNARVAAHHEAQE